ncbi:hypothetical protein [Paenibacillus sacheonensis]|uniref:Lipoprotein n=1 Tax=Paenibacillus sacheonensis TaxID=742054 RepID=A0A7X4YPD5_9BACL|nr:hypothetical protein [Paenibacillus sacheonensis]MBM7565209.1 hypothetical protein [Paenibacillus sacheonensis]NBC70015.1 hypothetical protein [Paenibacillus sacheonensis]
MIRKSLPVIVALALLLSACRLGERTIHLSDSPPQPLVTANGKAVQVYQSSYCWGDECADYVSAEEMLQDKKKDAIAANATFTFQYEGKQPKPA